MELCEFFMTRSVDNPYPLDPNFTNDEGENILMIAAKFGQVAIYQAFIARGWVNPELVSPDKRNRKGQTVLMLAATENRLEMCQFLLAKMEHSQRSVNLEAIDDEGRNVIQLVLQSDGYLSKEILNKKKLILSLLMHDFRIDRNLKDREGRTLDDSVIHYVSRYYLDSSNRYLRAFYSERDSIRSQFSCKIREMSNEELRALIGNGNFDREFEEE
jgi:ankyrin repeat protein